MSVPGAIGAVSPAADERAARKLRKKVGERQLLVCPSLISGMSRLRRRLLSLSQGQVVRREEVAKETETFKQLFSELRNVTRQYADLKCMEYLHQSLNGMSWCDISAWLIR